MPAQSVMKRSVKTGTRGASSELEARSVKPAEATALREEGVLPIHDAPEASPPRNGLFVHDHVCVFDRHWYLRAYPDVASSAFDPATHYREIGFKEGRAPNRFFDPVRYRELNPDLIGYDGDLLMHYVFYGAIEGRRIS